MMEHGFEDCIEALVEKNREAELKDIENIALTPLLKLYKLEPKVVSPRTEKINFNHIRKFAQASSDAGLPSVPSKPGYVAAYLHEQLEKGASYGTLRQISAAIARVHLLKGRPDPTKSDLIEAILQAARKKKAAA